MYCLGCEVGVQKGAALPPSKTMGAVTTICGSEYDPGSTVAEARSIPEIRGFPTHWACANPMWKFFARPLDTSRAYIDDEEFRSTCGERELWAPYWHIIEWPIGYSEDETQCGDISHDELPKLLPFPAPLCGPHSDEKVNWISADAALKRVGIIYWETKELLASQLERRCGSLRRPLAMSTLSQMLRPIPGGMINPSGYWGCRKGFRIDAANRNALSFLAAKKAMRGSAPPCR